VASLNYVGAQPVTEEGVVNRLAVTNLLDQGNSRSYANGRIAALAFLRADKTYVDTNDANYAEVSYYQTRDALNVPVSSKGQPGGVATLDGSGKVPSAQLPTLGTSIARGPWGVSSVSSGTTTGNTPLKIAEYNIGVTGWRFQPLVFLVVQVETTGGAYPVVEARIGTPEDTGYASQQLVARGVGKNGLDGVQAVSVMPAAPAGSTPGYFDPNLNTRINVWAYNAAEAGQVDVGGSAIFAGAVFIVRMTL